MFIIIDAEGTTSAQLRESFMERLVTPFVQCIFDTSETKIVTFAVAQYWNDNADDEVHFAYWPGPWPQQSIYAVSDDPWVKQYRTIRQAHRKLAERMGRKPKENYYVFVDGDNRDMVKAFASCCTEGGSQDDDFPEPYTPYAVFRAVEMEDADAAVAVDYLLGKGEVPRGMFGDWEMKLQNGVYVGEAPRRVIDEVRIIRECPTEARVSITTEIVGKVLRPEWEAVDASWVNPLGED